MLEQTCRAEQINKKRAIRNNGVILIWQCKQYLPNCQIKMTAKYSGYTVVLFGLVSSPFMLHAALKYHLTTEKSTTASDILANLYVDNVVSGCSNETRALEYYKEARCHISKANFNLRSWASNSSSLMALAQQDKVADNETVVNVLGLLWNTSQDTLGLGIKSFPYLETMQPTKRAVLQDLSKFLTPLGCLHQSPFQQNCSCNSFGSTS